MAAYIIVLNCWMSQHRKAAIYGHGTFASFRLIHMVFDSCSTKKTSLSLIFSIAFIRQVWCIHFSNGIYAKKKNKEQTFALKRFLFFLFIV